MFDNIVHIELFGINDSDQIIINELLSDGWKLLSIVQVSEFNNYSYGQIVLGADSEAFLKNNLSLIKKKKDDQKKKEIEEKERLALKMKEDNQFYLDSIKNEECDLNSDGLPF